jgi:hypothetical protein
MSVSEFRAADADAFVGSHIRRLQAFRRVGIVEQAGADSWPIPMMAVAAAPDVECEARVRMR